MLIRFSGRWHLFFPYSATSHVHESLYLTVYLGFISRHNKYWKKSSLYYQIIQDDEWRTTLPSMAYHNLAAVFLIKCVLVVHLMKMLHSNLVILSCTQTHTHTFSWSVNLTHGHHLTVHIANYFGTIDSWAWRATLHTAQLRSSWL